eukprot:scaffold881_cov123-Isochrysis_galbana.AAC.7
MEQEYDSLRPRRCERVLAVELLPGLHLRLRVHCKPPPRGQARPLSPGGRTDSGVAGRARQKAMGGHAYRKVSPRTRSSNRSEG